VALHKGYVVITDPDASAFERDAITCCHCNRVFLQMPLDIPPWCRKCQKPVCETCHQHGRCRPLEKWLERVEAQDRKEAFRRSLGL